jgi:hypothetical protein
MFLHMTDAGSFVATRRKDVDSRSVEPLVAIQTEWKRRFRSAREERAKLGAIAQ